MVRGRKSFYVPAVLQILNEYPGVLTVRQIFYRLVSKGIIPNKVTSYVTLCHAVKLARIRGQIPWNRIEDRSKPIHEGEQYSWNTPEEHFGSALSEYESAEDTFRDSHRDYSLPFWYEQPNYVEVWIEKDALSGVFSQVTQSYRVPLGVCRGYQSISNIYETACRMAALLKNHNRKPIILYFGDYDPRGENIPEVIARDFEALGFPVEVRKIALTREQVEQYHLIPQPCKKTDTMANNWIAAEGDNVWELDALEPNTLISIVKSAIEQHFDRTILEKRNQLISENQAQIKHMILSELGESEEEGES